MTRLAKWYPWNLDVSCVEPAEKLFLCLQKICFSAHVDYLSQSLGCIVQFDFAPALVHAVNSPLCIILIVF
jgi:hypothetical protein